MSDGAGQGEGMWRWKGGNWSARRRPLDDPLREQVSHPRETYVYSETWTHGLPTQIVGINLFGKFVYDGPIK